MLLFCSAPLLSAQNNPFVLIDEQQLLAYAYYFSEEPRYAQKAIELIRVWFLNKQTRMNPHLEYAQSVPGIGKKRRSGMLDGRLVSTHILDSIAMLQTSVLWTPKDNENMNAWLSDYLNWLTTSKLGKSGELQANNHGLWYFF